MEDEKYSSEGIPEYQKICYCQKCGLKMIVGKQKILSVRRAMADLWMCEECAKDEVIIEPEIKKKNRKML